MDLPPIFWDSMPENASEHDDMAAINALLEEDTPEERAETLKILAQLICTINSMGNGSYYAL
eukprot:scaffold18510_cov22-Prasinocladus_malaysianus.AAC.1